MSRYYLKEIMFVEELILGECHYWVEIKLIAVYDYTYLFVRGTGGKQVNLAVGETAKKVSRKSLRRNAYCLTCISGLVSKFSEEKTKTTQNFWVMRKKNGYLCNRVKSKFSYESNRLNI